MIRQLALLALCACAAACSPKSNTAAPTASSSAAKPRIFTTFYPTTYFAQRIVGDQAEVICPLPPGQDPVTWMPDAATLQAYQAADLIVINGAEFEKWVDKVSLPASKIVNTAAPFASELIVITGAIKHKHGPEGEHSHEGTDGHTWVDPVNALHQSEAVHGELVKRWPKSTPSFSTNMQSLQRDLTVLHDQASAVSQAWANRPLLASHPAYNYLAKRFKLNIRNLDLDPEEMPSEEALQGLGKLLAEHPAKVILWESDPKEEIAKALADRFGLKSVVFSPAESMDAADLAKGIDYLAVMKRNFQGLMEAAK